MRANIVQVICFGAFMCVTNVATAITIPIDPMRTYLFTNNDPWFGGSVPGTTPILLSEWGITGGDFLELKQLGDWYDGHAGYSGDVAPLDMVQEMIGAFSNGDTLLAPDVLHRVPDALDAGTDIVSWNTLFGDLTTDIPEDFGIRNTFLQVPLGATHLFVAAHDIYYSDNSDPDGDFAVQITRVASVPEPSTLLLLAMGLLALAWIPMKRSISARRV